MMTRPLRPAPSHRSDRLVRLALWSVLPLVALAGPAMGQEAAPAPEHTAQHTASPVDLGDIDGDGGVSAFYQWTGEIPAPGQMLRQEPLPADRRQPESGQALRILYSSTSGVGDQGPIVVSGMLFQPKGSAPKGGWPLVSWAHGTTGFADVCAPSWNGTSLRDQGYLQRWLEAGFAVVATDYEGLGADGVHPYLIWRSEGHAVLDAARAASAAYPAVLSRRVVLVGQSQGSGAAIGSAYLAKSYAPQLDLLGTVATGLVMTFDTPEAAGQAAKGEKMTDPRAMDPGFAMLRIAGTDRALNPHLDPADFVTPAGYPLLRLSRRGCLRDLMAKAEEMGLKDGQTVFTADLAPLDSKMDAAFAFTDGRIPGPLFVGTGLADDMAGTQGQYNAVRAMCAAGTQVHWHTYPGEDHSTAVTVSAADSIPFAQNLLKGHVPASNCASIQHPGPVQQRKGAYID
ncbi:hypothetical protein M2337_000340 [Sphingobium sp. B2D3A]|uniref:lipase family protein n=1 Tax=unclassified Sphingobium TaxID=2611147 RepID=UPI002224655C|nr:MULTISPECIES: lipase family protein [unclassified Sphingobium]MCW2336107.1 hypothetical protein [Sphingobium sp. B2D3A]